MRLFFFGTLMDGELRTLVIGRALPDASIEPATIRGFRRVPVAFRAYPMLVRRGAGRVDGVLVGGLDAAALRRLQAYEGEEYALRPGRVRTGAGRMVAALAFLCRRRVTPGHRDWRLDRWQRRHKCGALREAKAMLARAGQNAAPPPRPPEDWRRPAKANGPMASQNAWRR